MTADAMTTSGGLLLPFAVLVPFVGAMAGLIIGGRNAQRVAMLTIAAGLAIAVGVGATWSRAGRR